LNVIIANYYLGRRALARGSFEDVRRLEAAIMKWLSQWNENPHIGSAGWVRLSA
jgi:hypothetical protein